MKEKVNLVRLFLMSFRVYSLPYVTMLCLIGLILIFPDTPIYYIVVFSFIAILCWIGGMLYYDLSHAEEDKIKKPYRLLPQFPKAKGRILMLVFLLFFSASLIVFLINPVKSILLLIAGLTLMFLYDFFKKVNVFYGKYLIRGLGGIFLLILAPFIFSIITFEVILVCIAIFFLDSAGNLAGDIRDWMVDGASSIISRLGLKKTMFLQFSLAISGATLLSTLTIVQSMIEIFILLVSFSLIFEILMLWKINVNNIHKFYMFFKTALLLTLISIYTSPLTLILLIPVLILVDYTYRITHIYPVKQQ